METNTFNIFGPENGSKPNGHSPGEGEGGGSGREAGQMCFAEKCLFKIPRHLNELPRLG